MMSALDNGSGQVVHVAGPVVGAVGLADIRLHDVVRVGMLGLIGEVIRLSGDVATIQVYEDTSGLRVGEPVQNSGQPLVAQLGPGLLGTVYDGLQRPLKALAGKCGDFIERGVDIPALPTNVRWAFSPSVRAGDQVGPGDTLGTVPESLAIEHAIMVPPRLRGRVRDKSRKNQASLALTCFPSK